MLKRIIWGVIAAALGTLVLFIFRNVVPAGPAIVFATMLVLFILGFLLATPKNEKKVKEVLPILSSQDIEKSLDDLLKRIREPASKPIVAKVESIRTSILQTLPSIEDISDNTNKDIYLLRKVALEYLPTSLDNYLKMPYNVRRATELRDGKTAHDLMLEQLTLLDNEMKAIFESISKQETDKLRIHGRYLEQLFEKSDMFTS